MAELLAELNDGASIKSLAETSSVLHVLLVLEMTF